MTPPERPPMHLTVAPHPLLDAAAFVTRFDAPLGELRSPDELLHLLALDADAPLMPDEATRTAVRDLLRVGGYKPTGRGKPAAEYLVRAAERGALGGINPAVDACNVVSLHSGLPISVVDLAKTAPPLRIATVEAGAYVFNPTGQSIRLDGLLCLYDADGPCANAVKDSQRTKTDEETRRTLSVVWGHAGDPERTRRATAWYRSLLGEVGASTEPVPLRRL